MFKKLTNTKTLVIIVLIGIIIYFNGDIRAYIFFKSNNLPIGDWSMLKENVEKMEKLQNLFKNENDSIVFPDNQILIEKFNTLFNKNEFANTYNLFSTEFQQNHSNSNNAKFLETIFKEFGTIDSCTKEEINYSYAENINCIKSKESYITFFKNGKGSISVIIDMFDSVNTKINEIGFQLDSSFNEITIFKKQTEDFFNLLENNDYKKLNHLTTIEYNLSFPEDNFMYVNTKLFKQKNLKQIHTFVKLKKENDNSEISLVYEKDNKILEIALVVDHTGNYKINNFKLTE